MSAVSTIAHPEFGEIRTQVQAGEPVFVARDLCDVLEISKYRDAIAALDDDERGGPVQVDTPGGPQEMATVNEPGMYQLIFRSPKPEAKAFRKWIAHEVLPAIRRHGRYDPKRSVTTVLDTPVFEELPAPRRGQRSMWPPVLEKLRERPAEWARVGSCKDSAAAGRVVHHLRARKLAVPPGVWAFAARTGEDGRGLIYARYLGAGEVAPAELDEQVSS